MSGCRECDTRAQTVRAEKANLQRIARLMSRTDPTHPERLDRLKAELLRARTNLATGIRWTAEHEAECEQVPQNSGALVQPPDAAGSATPTRAPGGTSHQHLKDTQE